MKGRNAKLHLITPLDAIPEQTDASESIDAGFDMDSKKSEEDDPKRNKNELEMHGFDFSRQPLFSE